MVQVEEAFLVGTKFMWNFQAALCGAVFYDHKKLKKQFSTIFKQIKLKTNRIKGMIVWGFKNALKQPLKSNETNPSSHSWILKIHL